MSKVITFSRKFPSYHSSGGFDTDFVEKILNGLTDTQGEDYFQKLLMLNTVNIAKGKLSYNDLYNFWIKMNAVMETKLHTIRAGSRFKQGEIFSPRVWSGKPYNSPQIIFWEDLQVKRAYTYEVRIVQQKIEEFIINGTVISFNNKWSGDWFYKRELHKLAEHDGLFLDDFLSWFKHPKPFTGQIICWSDKINYV